MSNVDSVFSNSLIKRFLALGEQYPELGHFIAKGNWSQWPHGSDPTEVWDGAPRGGLRQDEESQLLVHLSRGRLSVKPLMLLSHWPLINGDNWQGFYVDRNYGEVNDSRLTEMINAVKTFLQIANDSAEHYIHRLRQDPFDHQCGETLSDRWIELLYETLEPRLQTLSFVGNKSVECCFCEKSIFAASAEAIKALEDARLQTDQFDAQSGQIRALDFESGNAGNVFLKRGHLWQLSYSGKTVYMKHTVGLVYISRLLGEPDRNIAAVLLLAERLGMDPRVASGSAGELLDGEARQSLKDRGTELLKDLAKAEGNNDTGKVERLQSEMDQLAKALASATGLGGRKREKSDAEKIRKSVSMAVSREIDKITVEHQALGNHLLNSISSGCIFRYSPESQMDWLT